MTLFDWLKEINVTKTSPDQFTDDDWKSFTPYMIHRYLSLHTELLDVVNHVQKFVSFSKPVIYDMYRRMLPKQPRFAKYIKGKKTKAQKDVELVAKYFEVSKKEAVQYYSFLTTTDIKQIKTIYGIK
tara:strand:+ start:111 stop:491 length:381 start_codon:yes stop_codon:yes gene_type:complete